MTKSEYATLAEMVRATTTIADQAILWHVRYNLALFLWGLESAEATLEALLKACNSQRDDNIVQRIGLERLEELRDKPLIKVDHWGERGFIDIEPEPQKAAPSRPADISEQETCVEGF